MLPPRLKLCHNFVLLLKSLITKDCLILIHFKEAKKIFTCRSNSLWPLVLSCNRCVVSEVVDCDHTAEEWESTDSLDE